LVEELPRVAEAKMSEPRLVGFDTCCPQSGGLPQDVFEAARVDNISAWRRFRDITFPMLLPLSTAVIFIRLIEGYKIVDTVYVLTGGGPGTSTETLTLYAYYEGFKKFNIGMTSALSFVFLIVVTIAGTLYLAAAHRLSRRYR
jgi:multiple sugar transport system permease protein